MSMTVSEMVDLLDLRVEDPKKQALTNAGKVRALNNAQLRVAALMDEGYLTQLEYLDADKSPTTGVFALSGLTSTPLRGKDGIQRVKVKDGRECTRIDMKDVGISRNQFMHGYSVEDPVYYLHENKIYLLPTSISAIDIYYLKIPTAMLSTFTMAAAGTPSTSKFLGAAGEGLSAADDEYNDVPIYCVGKDSYHVVTDYDAAGAGDGDLLFTVSPVAVSNFGADSFYFTTHDYDTINLSGIQCDLDGALHHLVVDIAEAELWGMVNQNDRKKVVMEAAFIEIKSLNDNLRRGVKIGKLERED